MIGYWCIGVLVYWKSRVASRKSQVKKGGVAKQHLPKLLTSYFLLLTLKNLPTTHYPLPTHALRPEVA
jgi:hypothetical protein